jgi:AcrR family transcriptional regulator
MPASARQPPSQPAVPHYARQAWKQAVSAPHPGGKRLNIATVVATAIEVADEAGLAALSIRHLAQRLSLTPMAVYRHVESREELIMLMLDAMLASPPVADHTPASWPDALTGWGRSLYARYEAHPWALDAPTLGMPSTPNLVRWMDTLLGDMEPTGLPILERLNVALLIAGHVRHIATVQLRTHLVDPPESADTLAQWLPQFVTADAFPFYARIFDAGTLGPTSGPDIEYGLARIIDGVRARCAASEHPSS